MADSKKIKERLRTLEVIQASNSPQEAIVRVDHELDVIREQIASSKSREVSPLKLAFVSGGCIIASTVLVPVAQSFLDNPEPVSCSAERKEARDLYREDGVWTPLPEDSTVEEQCNINTYVVNLPDYKEQPSDNPSSSGGSSDGSWGVGGGSSSDGSF